MEGDMRADGPLCTSVPFVMFDVSQQMQTHSRQTHINNIHSTDTSHFHSNCGYVLDDSCITCMYAHMYMYVCMDILIVWIYG